jgi:cobalt/nickel transport system permease protein
MHIPNGYLSSHVCGGTAALALTGLAATAVFLLRRRSLPPPRVAAATAAAIFAAQAVNFPVSGGTSGHLLGGLLVVLIAGPAAAVWIMGAVVTTQCLLFGDGGLHALGANLLNLALIAPLTAHWVVQRLQSRARSAEGQLAAIALASALSVLAAAAATSFELALSGAAPLSATLAAMLGTHAMIAIGEMLFTGALAFLLFDLLPGNAPHTYQLAMPGRTGQLLGGLILMTGLAVALTPLASAYPDGLETVAARLGFHSLQGAAVVAPFSPQQWPQFGAVAMVLASLLGVAAVTVAMWAIARIASLPRR